MKWMKKGSQDIIRGDMQANYAGRATLDKSVLKPCEGKLVSVTYVRFDHYYRKHLRSM